MPKYSACYEGFRIKSGSILADHREMCKFEDVGDIGYKRVSGFIMDIVDNAASAGKLSG